MGTRIVAKRQVLFLFLVLTAAWQGPNSMAASTEVHFVSLRDAHAANLTRLQAIVAERDIEEVNAQQRLADKGKLQLLIDKCRRYRIDLLDLRRSAAASDDDDLADAIGREIKKTSNLILGAETWLAQRQPTSSDPADQLPGGLERGLSLHYRFDSNLGSRIVDRSGWGNDGMVHGASWSSRGRRGGSFRFDGIDDHIEIPDSPSLRVDQLLTISVCVFLESEDGNGTGFPGNILSKSYIDQTDYRLDISGNHTISAILRQKETGRPSIHVDAEPSRCQVETRRWVNIVFVYDGHVAHTYVDGELDKTVDATGGIGDSQAPLYIGRCGIGSWQYGFTGRVDDVLIWNRNLSEAEVLGLWISLKRSARKPAWRDGGHCTY
jgi:hypothetical protein